MSSNLCRCKRKRAGSPVLRTPAVAFGLVLAIGLAGCANARPFHGVEWKQSKPTLYVELTPVAQLDVRDCGYSSLGTVAVHHGVPMEKLRDGEIVRDFGNRTLSAVDLIRMSGELGLVAYGYQGTIDDLRENLTKGRPMLVLLPRRPRVGKFPSLAWSGDTAERFVGGAHWVVVAGMTPEKELIVYDPSRGFLSMPAGAFKSAWRKQSMVCVLVARPEKPSG
jgi:ABC-type bacteriocin/lantibiotic exporter with double-glycine peptidase domain